MNRIPNPQNIVNEGGRYNESYNDGGYMRNHNQPSPPPNAAREMEGESRRKMREEENRRKENKGMDRAELLMRLTESEFIGLDMQLYLNTHPCDTAAIEIYNQTAQESKRLREEYERSFGPLFSYVSMSNSDYFSWIEEPWAWDNDYLMTQPRK